MNDTAVDATHHRGPTRRLRAKAINITAAFVVVLGTAAVVLAVHIRSGDPGTAKRNPDGLSDNHRVNAQIEHQANRFAAALTAGDVATLDELGFEDSDRRNVPALVVAFGHRADTVISVQSSDFGGRWGELTIAVPCKQAQPQQIVVAFYWKRTNWLRSNWFAFIQAPGSEGMPEIGCPAPS